MSNIVSIARHNNHPPETKKRSILIQISNFRPFQRQRENSPAFFSNREFPIFDNDLTNDLTIVDDSEDSEDEEDAVDEGIEKDGHGGCTSGGGGWANLPHILLEDILSYVPQKDRYSAALVCRRWAETFSAPRVWNKVEIHADSFMCKKVTSMDVSLYKSFLESFVFW